MPKKLPRLVGMCRCHGVRTVTIVGISPSHPSPNAPPKGLLQTIEKGCTHPKIVLRPTENLTTNLHVAFAYSSVADASAAHIAIALAADHSLYVGKPSQTERTWRISPVD